MSRKGRQDLAFLLLGYANGVQRAPELRSDLIELLRRNLKVAVATAAL